MMFHHHLAAGTRTVVMAQTRQIAEALAAPRDQDGPDARALGMAGEAARIVPVAWDGYLLHDVDDAPRLPSQAVLRGIRVEGSPEFPYIWGRFSPVPYREAPGTHPWLEAVLHTEALRRLSRSLGLTHRWGLDGPAARARAS